MGKSKKPKSSNGGLTKTQRKEVEKIAKDAAHELPEKKNFVFFKENGQLYHNKTMYISNFLECKQGTADPNSIITGDRLARIGDEMYLQNVNIRFWLSNKLDRPNVMYKLFMFWYDSDMTLSDATVYFTQTNKMLDRINNESISLIDSKIVFSTNNYAVDANNHEHSYLATLNKSWKSRKVTYDEGAAIPKNRTIGVAVVCYDAYGTLQTDNIASMAYNASITITDP